MILSQLSALAALAILPALAGPAAAARTYTLSGDDVAIWNPAGEVRVEAASGGQVREQIAALGARVEVALERVTLAPRQVVVQVVGQQCGEPIAH